MTVVFAIAMSLLVVAVGLAFVSRRGSAYAALGGCAALLAVGVAASLNWARPVLHLGGWLGFGPANLNADGLAGIFLGLAGLTGAAVSLAFAERPPRRTVVALHAIILLATATAIGSSQAFFFLLAWEGLTVALYLLAGADRERPGALLTGYFTAGLTKIGGGALLAAFALMYGRTGSFSFVAWAHAAPLLDPTTRGVAFVLFLIAFGTKVGIVPLQGAVPVAYSGAPRASAATVAVALAAGFYGLWRLIFDVLAPASLWWGELTVAVGAVTALVGVLYVVSQDDLKRFLGFSTIEHTGIVMMGFGVALIGQAVGQPKLVAAGLLAATLHVVAHGLGKTLAFLATDRLERATGTRELWPLGGLGRLLPRTAGGFALATFTLAAAPPFGGFVSEWFTLEALLQGFRVHQTLAVLLMALGAAALALTAGIGLLAFAKLYGFAFLGRAREALVGVREPEDLGLGLGLLTLVTVGLGVVAPWEIHLLGGGLSSLLGFDAATTTISHPLVLGPVFRDFSVLAPTWLAVVLPVYALLALGLVLLLRPGSVRRAPIWVTGSALEPARVQYRPAAYSNPLRVILRGAYGYRRQLRSSDEGRSPLTATLVLETRVVGAIEAYLYRPLTGAALRASGVARRLQNGRLSAYLLYMLIVLLAILAVIPTLDR